VSAFVPLPANEQIVITWPTPNQQLFTALEKFFARTRVNPDFGKPGWTRDCGRRFHRGCDIAPVNVTPTDQTTRVIFTDCATGKDFASDEPTFIPHDEVFAVFPGKIGKAVPDESASDFGRHVIIEHHWPVSGAKFFTLYGHLAEVLGGAASSPRFWKAGRGEDAAPTGVVAGLHIGTMGQTSRSADARNWMAIAPHLHFEVRDGAGNAYDPVEFLKRFLPAR